MRTIGVDTGGTFTDLVSVETPGRGAGAPTVRVEKVHSTPADPGRAVLEGIARLGGLRPGDEIVHGTTVALNALLTGAVARTALVTNEGFRDLVEIGRQNRPELYALHPRRTEPLAPRELRFEVPQRTWPDAEGRPRELRAPTPAELARLVRELRQAAPESIAICLLHSYADPSAEARVAQALAALGVPITCSAAILPEHREIERFSTALVNAALVPRMQRYLDGLSRGLTGARLSILQSAGGTLPAERAALEPARVLFSGPAGGVVGAGRAAREAGLGGVVTLDMGGTSTDVAFHAGGAGLDEAVTDTQVAGHPVGVPALDLHTIGCGGGSLVHVDAGGVLHVGPASAGADPGPVCYGRGDIPTVTDAHVRLGHLDSGPFLGGRLELDHGAVRRAFERLGARLGVSAERAAQAVLDVARAQMRRAIAVMTMQRGRDPRRLALVAFGGAGGLHGAALAGSLGAPAALVPALPGLLSAAGMAHASALSDHALTVLAPLSRWSAAARRRALAQLAREGAALLREAGRPRARIEVETRADLRYAGQSFELSLPDPGSADLARRFHARHLERFGWSLPEREIELVSLRARALVHAPRVEPAPSRRRTLPRGLQGRTRRAFLGGAWHVAPVLERERLTAGQHWSGPSLVEEFSGTTLVPPGWGARITAGGHLLLEPLAG